MLNWIVSNATVFDIETVLTLKKLLLFNRTELLEKEMFSTIKLFTYAKLSCLK